jgi:hypothetical protein
MLGFTKVFQWFVPSCLQFCWKLKFVFLFTADNIVTIMQDMLASMSEDLTVYYNTVVTNSKRDHAGRVVSVEAVRRYASPHTSGWERTLSNDLLDWYSPAPSKLFSRKEVLVFEQFDNIIEATEFGDVLMTSGDENDIAQGMETPDENSTTLITACGQSFVYPFYIEYGINQVTTLSY